MNPAILTAIEHRKLLLGLLLVFLCGSLCSAFLRHKYSDEKVVARSEAIVVGKIKSDSIKFVPLIPDREGDGVAWVHHAELLISESLSGDIASSAIVVRIGYGLYPIAGGVASNEFKVLDVRRGDTNFPKDFLGIYDTGSSLLTDAPITGDIRTNHIWFLRHMPGASCGDTNLFGVFDPEDIKPVSTKQEIVNLIKGRTPTLETVRKYGEEQFILDVLSVTNGTPIPSRLEQVFTPLRAEPHLCGAWLVFEETERYESGIYVDPISIYNWGGSGMEVVHWTDKIGWSKEKKRIRAVFEP